MGVSEDTFTDSKSGALIEAHMTAVSWRDGDICQIKSITNLKNINFNEKDHIIDNKQPASKITVEQGADLGGQCLSTKVI